MKDLRFRGTDPVSGSKHKVTCIDFADGNAYLENNTSTPHKIEDVKLEVATDFYDIDGVRIYEGDEIIRIENWVRTNERTKHKSRYTKEFYEGVVELGRCSADAQGYDFMIQAFQCNGGFLCEEDKYRILK